MGANMAANLLKAGHELVVHDKNAEAVHRLQVLGATSAASPAEVATVPGTRMTSRTSNRACFMNIAANHA